MTTQYVPVAWCMLQTALIASLGLVATRLLSRRAPGAAATAAAAAAATILAVTLLLPVPLPNLELLPFTTAGDALAVANHVARPAPDAVPASGAEANEASVSAAGGAGVDVAALIEPALRFLGAGAINEQRFKGLTESCAARLAFVGAAIGLVRLASSLRHLRRLRRSRTLIVDAAMAAQFAELADRLGVRRRVELCESTAIASPAVLGWRRPIVLLPADRTGWSSKQLRAALAHELAHVVRGDFAWRAAAACVQAVHFFHPLVHLLTRRLALVQEVAADRLAAAAVGGLANYLQALSELAIRLDDQMRLRAEPIVMPAFSTGLMRRITMLRSKEGSVGGGRRSALGVAAAAAIVLFGAGTMALRGSAETAEAYTDSAEAQGAAAMFDRTPIGPGELVRGEQGMLVVRVNELSKQPAIAPLIQLVNEMVSEQLAPALGGASAPRLRLEAIEYLACEIQAKVTPKTGSGESQKGQVVLGCEDLVIRFVTPVDWQAWLTEHVSDAVEVVDDGFAYFKLPALPAMGPTSMRVAERDGRTLVFSANVDRLRQMAANRNHDHASAERSTVHGGLVAIAFDSEIEGLKAQFADSAARKAAGEMLGSDPTAIVLQALCLNSRRIEAGFDLAEESGESAIQIRLACATQEEADKICGVLTQVLPIAKAWLQQVLVDADSVVVHRDADVVQVVGVAETDRLVLRWYADLVENCQVSVEGRDDGGADVQITAAAPFPESIMTMFVPAIAMQEIEAVKRARGVHSVI